MSPQRPSHDVPQLSTQAIAEIERDCYRLMARYAHLVDLGNQEEVADLFTEHGVWESAERRLVGRDAIRGWFAEREQRLGTTTQHDCSNALVTVKDARHAEGIVYFTAYRHDATHKRTAPAPLDGPVSVGLYRDVFVLTDDGWRFAHRRAEVRFLRPIT
jgi:hypothetical protein